MGTRAPTNPVLEGLIRQASGWLPDAQFMIIKGSRVRITLLDEPPFTLSGWGFRTWYRGLKTGLEVSGAIDASGELVEYA